MRLHTSKLTDQHIRDAARKASVTIEHLGEHGSRKARRAFEVALSGSGRRATNSGKYGAGNVQSATWDEWGIFLGELYTTDPQMIAGEAYQDAEHFHWVTGDRYRSLKAGQKCRQHEWNYQGRCVTGAYSVSECPKCGAILRRLSHGHRWQDIA